MVFEFKEKQPTGKKSPNENTKRKDTGRTDEYSDETPRKDFEDYTKKNPHNYSRDDMKKDGKIDIQKRTIEMVKQESISCIQSYQESFNSAELNMWENKLSTLTHELQKFRK